MMKRVISILLLSAMILMLCACGQGEEPANQVEPEITQMRAICELATMDCYYHNVAKYYDKDAEKGILGIGKKDKKFWVEYSGEVTLGVDAALVSIQISETTVTITMPQAKVLGVKVYSESLTEDSFIVDKDSADVTAEDQTTVFQNAQSDMMEQAANDQMLLQNAQQRAQMLLEDYVINIGHAMGIQYQINWVYVDENGEPIDNGVQGAASTETSAPADTD